MRFRVFPLAIAAPSGFRVASGSAGASPSRSSRRREKGDILDFRRFIKVETARDEDRRTGDEAGRDSRFRVFRSLAIAAPSGFRVAIGSAGASPSQEKGDILDFRRPIRARASSAARVLHRRFSRVPTFGNAPRSFATASVGRLTRRGHTPGDLISCGDNRILARG